MMETALHPLPRPREVWREQVRATGLALRVPALTVAALLALLTLALTVDVLRRGVVLPFHPHHQMLPAVLGVLLPIAVWRGEERFGPGFLWTLPVDRSRHALARVFAGWVWLMGAVALFVLWQLGLALLSGASILAHETISLLPAGAPRATGTIDPAVLRTVRWTPQPLLWLVPFTAATGTYLLSSALAVGARHPLRWIVGTVLGFAIGAATVDMTNAEIVADAAEPLLEAIFYGPYGLDTLLTARTESLKIDVALPDGEVVIVWRGLPDLGDWAAGTLLWILAGLALLRAAAARHRERRRS